jgi:Cysteine-rich secretory protein family
MGRTFRYSLTLALTSGLLTFLIPSSAVAADPYNTSAQQTLINQDRSANGSLAPLAWNDCLAGIAKQNADRIAAQGSLSHTNGPTLDLGCIAGATSAGENIAYWSGGIDDPQANTMFMNSAPHRANILGTYNYVATAWTVASNGYGYIAEEFLNAPGSVPPPPGPPAPPVPDPFKALFTLDGWGGIHADGSTASMTSSGYWPNWKIARAVALLPDASGGFVLDGYGGIHQFGATQQVTSAYFGWDIARDIVFLPTATSANPQGYTLDGWGGIHAFGGAPATSGGGYWPNFDIAKRLVLLSDGTGGYILDGWGGLHRFAVGSNPMPPAITNFGYWPHWNIARDIALTPGSTANNVSGVTLDGFGGVHPFGSAAAVTSAAYWRNWDIARSVRLSPQSTAAQPQGWTLDGYGGLHPFGGAPAVASGLYVGQDLAVQLAEQ